MNQKLQEFVRESLADMMKELSPEERVKGLSAEQLRKALPVEERFKGLTADEMIRALTPEMREALARHFKVNGSSPKPE
jgi:hypothetical protein